MSIDNLQAVGEFVYLIKDEAETERNGLLLPEPSIKKPNMGIILSVGEVVQDTRIVKGRKAIFNKAVGEPIELFGVEITVLNGNQQISGVL